MTPAAGISVQPAAISPGRAAVTDFPELRSTFSAPGPVTSDNVRRAAPELGATIDQVRVSQPLTDNFSVNNALVPNRALAFLPSGVTVAADNIDRAHAQLQLAGSSGADNILLPVPYAQALQPTVNCSSVVNTSMYDRVCPSPLQQTRYALPAASALATKPQQLIAGLSTGDIDIDLNVLTHGRAPQTLVSDVIIVVPPPPPISGGRALPVAIKVTADRANLRQQLINNSDAVDMPLVTSNTAAAINRAQTVCTSSQPGPLSALSDITALHTRLATSTVIDMPAMVSDFQFSTMMTGD